MKHAKKTITVNTTAGSISKDVVFGYDQNKHTAESAFEAYEKYKINQAALEQEFNKEREEFLLKEKAFKEQQANLDMGILSLEAYTPDTHDHLLNENTVQK